ncbi:MAG: hypothetical protein AAF307_12575 [Pseudomonadota bacterium]
MSLGGLNTALLEIDPRVGQAIVAGAFLAAGWLYNGWKNRQDARRLRAERLRDVHRALYAEIGTTTANMVGAAALTQEADVLVQRMQEEPDFVPFIPQQHGDHMYDAIVAEIHILPRCTIDPVVAYYSQIKTLGAFAEDMRGPAFAQMGQDRRIIMYRDYIAMKQQLFEFGKYATAMIKAYSDGGKQEADRLAAALRR